MGKENLKLYDFYYSAEQDALLCEMNLSGRRKTIKNYMNGIRYTETIAFGNKPISNFKDLKLVHTGFFDMHSYEHY